MGGKASTSGDVYSFEILLLEMIIVKKPTDRMLQEGLSLNKFLSEMHECKILDITDPRLFKDIDSLTRSSSVAAMVRVGLSCVAHSSKERFSIYIEFIRRATL